MTAVELARWVLTERDRYETAYRQISQQHRNAAPMLADHVLELQTENARLRAALEERKVAEFEVEIVSKQVMVGIRRTLIRIYPDPDLGDGQPRGYKEIELQQDRVRLKTEWGIEELPMLIAMLQRALAPESADDAT